MATARFAIVLEELESAFAFAIDVGAIVFVGLPECDRAAMRSIIAFAIDVGAFAQRAVGNRA